MGLQDVDGTDGGGEESSDHETTTGTELSDEEELSLQSAWAVIMSHDKKLEDLEWKLEKIDSKLQQLDSEDSENNNE